jgi:hypothetical protein
MRVHSKHKVLTTKIIMKGPAAHPANKEKHRVIKLWIKRKNSRKILYSTDGNIVNSPLSLYIIPYDSYGTLVSDNIASCAFAYASTTNAISFCV